MEDIFLLKETDQRYFSRLTESFFNAMEAEGIGREAEAFEFTGDQIQRIAKKMPYSPANAVKKWNAATKRPHFSIMVVEKHRPVENKQENEPLAADEFFINEQPTRKSRYKAITELYFIRSDKLPTAHPIAPKSPAYKLIRENLQAMNSDADIMREIRESLNLAGFYYINLGLFSSTNFVIGACKMLAQGSTPFSIENPLLEVAMNTAGNIDGDFPFSTIRQGTSTNTLTKLRATKGNSLTMDRITGDATIRKGNFILTIPNYKQLIDSKTSLKTSTYQLLDAITVAFTESGAKSPTVILPLEEYMKRRGLKDRKEAKTQAKADMEILRGASFSWEERRGKKTETYNFVNLADSGEVRRNGDIVFTYGNTFYNVLLSYPIMPYPAQLQTLNSKRNPNSYYFLRKIAEHKNMNIGKKNEDIIAVNTLLNIAPFIPLYDEVMATDRALNRRIIEPFERDMDALTDTLTWAYCHSNNTQLTSEELESFSYEKFISLLVKIEWRNYPDQTTRLEKKAEKKGG